MPASQKNVVDRFVALCKEAILDHIIAIAVVGSHSRGDFVLEKSDVDLLVVMKSKSARNRKVYKEVSKICQKIDPTMKTLKDVFIYAQDEFSSPYLISTFTYLWLCDVKHNGKVVYGNKDIFKQIKIPEEIDTEMCRKIMLWSKLLLKNLSFQSTHSPEMRAKTISYALLNHATCLVALKHGKILFDRRQLAQMCEKLFTTDLIYQAITNKHIDKISINEAEKFHERAVSFVVESFEQVESD